MPELVSHPLDTHAMIKDFVAGGFTEKQAETQVRALSNLLTHNLATRHGLEEVRKDLKIEIEALRKETKTDIEQLRKETKTDIEQLRKEMKTDIELVRKDIELLRRDLSNLVLKAQLAGVGATVAILSAIRFFL